MCITVQVATKTQSYQTKQARVKKGDHPRAVYIGWGFHVVHSATSLALVLHSFLSPLVHIQGIKQTKGTWLQRIQLFQDKPACVLTFQQYLVLKRFSCRFIIYHYKMTAHKGPILCRPLEVQSSFTTLKNKTTLMWCAYLLLCEGWAWFPCVQTYYARRVVARIIYSWVIFWDNV